MTISLTPRSGIVFDIREFTLHDGPGVRTTGYFCGLAPEYQDHVIARHLHTAV